MKKLSTKIFSVLLMLIMATSVLLACGDAFSPEEGEEPIDTTKTQLYIGNVNQGFGEDWLRTGIKPRFEEFYKDAEFEPGKKGVQLIIGSTDYGTGLISTIAGNRDEVFFSESVAYYQFVNGNKLYDITDALNTPLTEYGESRTIIQKMNSDMADYFNAGTEEEKKFYALPFYETYFTIIYNADLFRQEKLYRTTAGNGRWNTEISWTSDVSAANIAPGPDKDIATGFDNGLPATYDEYFELCERIKQKGLVPLTWNGASGSYPGNFLMNMAANASGYDEMLLNYTFSGESKSLAANVSQDSVSRVGTVTLDSQSTGIGLDKGYELSRQEGKYYALEFFDRVLSGGYYNESYLGNSTVSHTEAQNAFIRTSEFGGNSIGKDTAMLIDGTWWMNEAKNTFNSLVGIYGENAGTANRSFAIMPLPMPRADYVRPGETTTETVFLDKHMSAVFVNGNITENKKELAKKFIRFCHTDQSIVEFTKFTNTVKPYSYEHTEEDLNGFTPYARSVINLKQHSKTVYAYSKSRIYMNAAGTLTDPAGFWAIQGQTQPQSALTSAGGYTAKTYFDGLKSYNTKSSWDNKYSRYY